GSNGSSGVAPRRTSVQASEATEEENEPPGSVRDPTRSPFPQALTSHDAIGHIELEGRALVGVEQRERSAVPGDELVGDRQAKTRAADPRRALERLEQMLASLARHAGPVSPDLDENLPPITPCFHPDIAGHPLALPLDRLHRIPAQVVED